MSRPAATTDLRVGLIGTGAWALGAHVPALRATGRARIVALADADGERARELAAQVASPLEPVVPYADWRALVASPEVDAVVVTSQTPARAGQIMEAIHHGKPVLCEAPLAHGARAARELAGAARSRRVITGYTRPRAFSYGGAAAARALAEGAVGELRSARLELFGDPWLRLDPDDAWTPGAESGPPPRACVVAGLLIEFFGVPHDVEGTLAIERDGDRADARVQLRAEVADGIAVEALAGPGDEPSMFFDVMGSDGTLQWELGRGGRVTVTSNRGQVSTVAEPGTEEFSAPREFVEAALAGEQHALDFTRAAVELELIESLRRA